MEYYFENRRSTKCAVPSSDSLSSCSVMCNTHLMLLTVLLKRRVDASAMCSTLQSARHYSRPRFVLLSVIPGLDKKYGVKPAVLPISACSQIVEIRTLVGLDTVRPRIEVIQHCSPSIYLICSLSVCLIVRPGFYRFLSYYCYWSHYLYYRYWSLCLFVGRTDPTCSNLPALFFRPI